MVWTMKQLQKRQESSYQIDKWNNNHKKDDICIIPFYKDKMIVIFDDN
jgi:hypothetical protein